MTLLLDGSLAEESMTIGLMLFCFARSFSLLWICFVWLVWLWKRGKDKPTPGQRERKQRGPGHRGPPDLAARKGTLSLLLLLLSLFIVAVAFPSWTDSGRHPVYIDNYAIVQWQVHSKGREDSVLDCFLLSVSVCLSVCLPPPPPPPTLSLLSCIRYLYLLVF